MTAPLLAVPKSAVTPAGSPVAVKVTAELKPLTAPIVTIPAELPPRGTASEPGVNASVKLGASTVTLTVVVTLRVPEVPVTVTGNVPAAAVALAAMVNRLALPAPHVAVTPAGSVPTENCTLPVKPLTAPTAIVEVPVPGREMVTVAADGVSVKDGMTTVAVTTVEAVREPETPLIVMG
jgi:hypothetical protein